MVWRVETVTTGLGGVPLFTVLWFNDSVGTADDATTAVENFWTDLAPMIVNECSMQVQGDVHTVDPVTNQITGVTVASVAGPIAGTNVSEPAPLSTQGLLQWFTGEFHNGRQLRGRTFIPGVPSSGVSVGKPTTGYKAAVLTAGLNLMGDSNTVLNVFSRVNGVARAVTGVATWSDFAVLRSRRD